MRTIFDGRPLHFARRKAKEPCLFSSAEDLAACSYCIFLVVIIDLQSFGYSIKNDMSALEERKKPLSIEE